MVRWSRREWNIIDVAVMVVVEVSVVCSCGELRLPRVPEGEELVKSQRTLRTKKKSSADVSISLGQEN